MTKDEIRSAMAPLVLKNPGIESWLLTDDNRVYSRISKIDQEPLTKVQLNQLLVLGHEAGVSDGCFQYYWLEAPGHSYDVKSLEGYSSTWHDNKDDNADKSISSLQHLRWGLYRVYVDALLYFGNVRAGYRFVRNKTRSQLEEFFAGKSFDTQAIRDRGHHLKLEEIGQDARYLISEIACKTMEAHEVRKELNAAYRDHVKRGGGLVSIQSLLDGSYVNGQPPKPQGILDFTAHPILNEIISSKEQLTQAQKKLEKLFGEAREAALRNTELYLSMVNDLDVYVATSMRSVEDFRSMAGFCSDLFTRGSLADLRLRYFDPTISAASGHEDKGLIECLMVKCAKVLVYFAGQRDSYGKDSEAAMALSLGKPVVFYCETEERERFLREVHPLSRLIHFETGVAVGAMVADSVDEVQRLLSRIFDNKMQYRLKQPRANHLQLVEAITESVVRLQTSDELLRETFWNYYHGDGK
jgi:hypothetical protein